MTMRRLVYVLLAANLLYALWWLIRPVSPVEDAVPEWLAVTEVIKLESELVEPVSGLVDEAEVDESSAAAGGSDEPELAALALLLAVEEPQVDLSAGMTGVAGEPSGVPVVGRCARIGPFGDDMELNRFLVAHVGDRPHAVRVTEYELPPLHRVMMPATDTRAEAQEVLAAVRAVIERIGANIDTYLMIGGEFDNAVSLGVFGERANALNVQRVMTDNGYPPRIHVENRVRQSRELMMNLEEDDDFSEEIAVFLSGSGQTLELTENLCEMIAQPE